MEYLEQIAKALKDSQTPFWKANVIMTQARLESGQFNKTNPSSIFVQSGYTNPFGMMYPTNAKRYKENGGNVIGKFRSISGKNWALYSDVYGATLDRLHWDRLMVNPSINTTSDYIARLQKLGYWVEDGVDRGYTNTITNLVNKYEAEHRRIYDQSSTDINPPIKTLPWYVVPIVAFFSILGIDVYARKSK
jgi:hypothetical protein